MRIINLIWGFTLGAGIDKCFLTYSQLGDVDKNIYVKNVCINVLSRNSHIESLKKLNVEFIDIRTPLDFSWINKLHKCIIENKTDILFTHGFNGAIMALIEHILKRISIKIVLTYHGAYHAPTKAKKIIEPLYNWLTHWIYKRIATVTICVAECSQLYLQKKGVPVNKIVTVHNGIKDILPPKPINIQHDKINIITASRIDKVKGLIYMIDAIEILKSHNINFHYYMIGEGPELKELKRICKEKDLEDCISFEGFQNNIPEWMAATDIFVLPSLFEYHSIAVLEAMRAGKAIIATNVGGNGESINDNEQGLLIPAANSKALAEAIEFIIRNEKLRKQFAENARKRFENEFSEEAMKKNLVNVLRNL